VAKEKWGRELRRRATFIITLTRREEKHTLYNCERPREKNSIMFQKRSGKSTFRLGGHERKCGRWGELNKNEAGGEKTHLLACCKGKKKKKIFSKKQKRDPGPQPGGGQWRLGKGQNGKRLFQREVFHVEIMREGGTFIARLRRQEFGGNMGKGCLPGTGVKLNEIQTSPVNKEGKSSSAHKTKGS